MAIQADAAFDADPGRRPLVARRVRQLLQPPVQVGEFGVDRLPCRTLRRPALLLERAAPRLQLARFFDTLRLARLRVGRRADQHAADHPVAMEAAVVQSHLLAVVALLGLEVGDAEQLPIEIAQAAELRHVRTCAIVVVAAGRARGRIWHVHRCYSVMAWPTTKGAQGAALPHRPRRSTLARLRRMFPARPKTGASGGRKAVSIPTAESPPARNIVPPTRTLASTCAGFWLSRSACIRSSGGAVAVGGSRI